MVQTDRLFFKQFFERGGRLILDSGFFNLIVEKNPLSDCAALKRGATG